jgi:hypothetical protein
MKFKPSREIQLAYLGILHKDEEYSDTELGRALIRALTLNRKGTMIKEEECPVVEKAKAMKAPQNKMLKPKENK